jgi:hypothetical protein
VNDTSQIGLHKEWNEDLGLERLRTYECGGAAAIPRVTAPDSLPLSIRAAPSLSGSDDVHNCSQSVSATNSSKISCNL